MISFENTIKDLAENGTLLVIEPGGNHGDSLIYYGFYKLADANDIQIVGLTEERFRNDRPPNIPSMRMTAYPKWILTHIRYITPRIMDDISAVYIQGGGNFNDLWEGGVTCFRMVARYYDVPIIVGPQSCTFTDTNPKQIFESVGNEVHFFCREKYSYDIIRDATDELDNISVYLSDDTALYLNPNDLPIDQNVDKYELLAMRDDKESTSPIIQQDVSAPIKVTDISITEPTFEDWVNAAAKASHIYTDRLHVAVLGTILGKPVTWYEVGYHKSRGVYEYSLSNKETIEFYRTQ